MSHKALDIPEEPVINAPRTSNGIPGWVIPATALIAATAWLLPQFLNRPTTPAEPEPKTITKTEKTSETLSVDMIVEPPQ